MSAEQFADTPAEKIGDVDTTGSLEVSIKAWGDHHDVYEWMLPLRHRKNPPEYYLAMIRDYINDARETQETFVKKDLEFRNDGNRVVDKCLKVWHVTEMRETSRGTRYRNPQYKFYEERTVPVTNPWSSDVRHDHYQRWKDIPTIEADFFAHHWGVDRNSATDWIRENYTNWREQRHRNRIRLAKTIETYRQWADKSLADLFRLLPMKYTTGKDWVNRLAVNTDWQPPERPTNKTWFCRSIPDE